MVKYHKKSFQHLIILFMSTWWGDSKICKKLNSQDGFFSYLQNSTFFPCLGLPSKGHCENSIFSIFLESPYQVDTKNVVKCWKDFLCYFTTLETYRDLNFSRFYLSFVNKGCSLGLTQQAPVSLVKEFFQPHFLALIQEFLRIFFSARHLYAVWEYLVF